MSDAPERVALDILYDAAVDYDQLPTSMADRCYAVLDAMIAENARLREALREIESETAQIWPQSLLDDMPAVRRIQDIARRALNQETTNG